MQTTIHKFYRPVYSMASPALIEQMKAANAKDSIRRVQIKLKELQVEKANLVKMQKHSQDSDPLLQRKIELVESDMETCRRGIRLVHGMELDCE